jgi:signal transduction histidine kinase
LAICKQIVDEHKGQIAAQNQPGEGALFRFTLQRAMPA